MNKRFTICLPVFAALLLSLASCSGPTSSPITRSASEGSASAIPQTAPNGLWEETVSAARKEGKVVVYVELGSVTRDAINNGFRNRYGIEVEAVAGRSAEVAQKFMTEQRANLQIADVFILGGTTLLVTLKQQGVLAPLAPVVLQPEALDTKAWPEGGLPFLDKDKTTVALAAIYYNFLVRNTDMVGQDEVKSFQDLLDPKWKGKVALFDPAVSGSGVAWLTFVMNKVMTPGEGQQYLERFAKQEPAITQDARLHVEWVARGKYPIGVGASFNMVPEFQAAGAPLAYIRVTEGALMQPISAILALPPKPSHPNASIVLANWLLTTEGQHIFSQAFGAPPTRLDVPKEGFDPLLIPRPGDKIYWYTEDYARLLSKAGEVGKQIFGQLMK